MQGKHNKILWPLFAIFAAVVMASSCAPAENTAIPLDKELEKKVDGILRGMTLEDKVAQMAQISSPSTYVLDETIFPQQVNIAATFNREHAFKMGKVIACESRAANVPWTSSPTLDLGRNRQWPGMWESFGEDTYVNAQMAVAEVMGMQGNDPNHIGPYNVAACVRFYIGYGMSELREKHFEPFKQALEAGALSLMVNSASINGLPLLCNTELLTQWVKEDLKWDGMIVTYLADINNLYTRERVASSKKEAIKLAVNAGVDMTLVPHESDFALNLVELVNDGEVSMERVDDAVRRILRLKIRLGLFENPDTHSDDNLEYEDEAHARLAYEAALESEVLLKNDGILPLDKNARILLTGPDANSIYEALDQKFQNVIYVQLDENTGAGKAVAAARKADVVVACVGGNTCCETMGNCVDLNLPANQRELVKSLAATGKPVVLILNEGRPRIVNEIEPLASAVVDILLPGNHGADALASLLSGEENFSAKLPFTYPKSANMFAEYDCKTVLDVQWPFGHGLSYTTYEYSNLKVSDTEFASGDIIKVSVDVTNTGEVEGKESVLLFSTDMYASSTPDLRRLRAFDKVALAPGETRTVKFELPADDLAFVNYYGKWTLEEGDFILSCGGLEQNVKCTSTKVWDTPNK